MVKFKKGRKEIAVIESLPYSSIILLVSSGKNYADVIAEATKKDSSTIARQLRDLIDKKNNKNFLISLKESEGKTLQHNKTIYSVNYEKIIEEFISHIRELLEEANKEHKELEKYQTEIEKKIEDINFSNTKEYTQNKYLLEFFRVAISSYEGIKTTFTLKDLFNDMINNNVFSLFTFHVPYKNNSLSISSYLETKQGEEKTLLINKLENDSDYKTIEILSHLINHIKNRLTLVGLRQGFMMMNINIILNHITKKEFNEHFIEKNNDLKKFLDKNSTSSPSS